MNQLCQKSETHGLLPGGSRDSMGYSFDVISLFNPALSIVQAEDFLNLCQKTHSVDRLTATIVDDDPVFGAILKSFIQKSSFIELTGVFTNPEEGLQHIMSERPQILFLDMEMPGLKGTQIIQNISYQPEIILISASSAHGIEAYDLGVTDYIQKPLENYARFLRAVEKAKANILQRISTDEKFLFAKVDSSYVNISKAEILMVQAYGDYVKLITKTKTYVIKNKIGEVEEKLGSNFVRVHRSFIVNIEMIANIEQNNIEIGDHTVPISGSYKENLLQRIRAI